MKLSIIIPYYNGERWIATCLDSLLRQDLSPEDYEIIVVDDGSTHSIETLMTYVETHPNIHYLHQENQKHAAARNYGLTIAKGDYIFFCDCDDYVADNVLGRLCDIALEEIADVLMFNALQVKENEEKAPTKRNFEDQTTFESGLTYMSHPPYHFRGGVWQYLIRRTFMEEKHLRFAPKMINREEHLYSLQMLLVSGKVVKVDVDVYYYVQHPASWVHSAGIASNSYDFINCMLTFLKYLHKTRLELAATGKVSPGCLEAMSQNETNETICILHNIFRFTSITNNKMGFYPIKCKNFNYDWLRLMMNCYPFWMTLCCCFHILPSFARRNLSLLIKSIKKQQNRYPRLIEI